MLDIFRVFEYDSKNEKMIIRSEREMKINGKQN